jgi:hypothetical protein
VLKRSKDRKVTTVVNGKGNAAVVANSFGIPSGTAYACPGATSFCERICYAGKLEKVYSGVRNVLLHNWTDLLYADYLDGIDGMAELLAYMVSDFIAESNKRGGELLFRIHWDGDFFSIDYAKAWAKVVKAFPQVTFWVYTRSFDSPNVLPFITGIPNMVVYLSADPVNIDLANARAAEYPDTFIATVADTFALASETIIDLSRKRYNCPENGKRIALIDEKGSACVKCGICIKGRGDVLFSVSKK